MNIIKCVVPISGGKDSQCCVKLALQKFDKSEILGVFCDTKFEHPLTYAHVDKISEMYGIEIVRLMVMYRHWLKNTVDSQAMLRVFVQTN